MECCLSLSLPLPHLRAQARSLEKKTPNLRRCTGSKQAQGKMLHILSRQGNARSGQPKSRTLRHQILAGMGTSGSLICRRWEGHTAQLLHKTVRPVLPKRNTPLPYVPPVTLLGIYPEELKTSVHTKIRTQVFTAALDITDKCRKQAKCSSVGHCVHQLWDRPDNGILVTAKKKGATKPQKDIEET